ncbi:GNAT family N-acetyltransferase [Clostridium rectalis]|uniref:GNAT family N-acetyltransferase n=1 Tax=Clostridium rectalis TaxID=2040295 RepID=UPI000F63E5CD|nr:GNAT family N-acetyltransferase [Clostridium rectalis]
MIESQELFKIVRLWNNNIGNIFPLDNGLFHQNITKDRNLLRKDIIGAFVENKLLGFIIFKQQIYKNGIIEPDKTQGNINSIVVDFKYRNQGIGSKLLYIAENILLARGVKRIELGRDSSHFFPGMPMEFIECKNFFNNNGYKDSNISSDLINDISKVDFTELKRLKKIKLNSDEEFKIEYYNSNERNKLEIFFEKNFPGRWLGDIVNDLNKGIDGNEIIILKDLNKNTIIGFSRIYHKESIIIGPPIYWRKLLGKNYGGLGPIGIDKEYRKKRLGITLLWKSLEILKDKGTKAMCIDWTDLYDFYGMFNFIPWKAYTHMNKNFI